MNCDIKKNMKLMSPSLEPWKPTRDVSRQIAVLMSGGVDSSVTAYLLKQQGWDVLGITMKIPVACDIARGCCGADAAFVCDKLGIAHYFIDTSQVFKELIIERFCDEYSQGRTPNPCVDCNTLLKFDLVWDFITKRFGIQNIATGHYAKIKRSASRSYLCQADDIKKDQSYFIYGIKARRLNFFHLPLGDVAKKKKKKIAADINLPVANKPESMELCFAGEQDYRTALNESAANKPGDLTDMQGNIIGKHKGIANYTIGQRRGLRFAGGEPLYVGRIDVSSNIVALGKRQEVMSRTLIANQLNCLWPEKFAQGTQLHAKIRSYGKLNPCTIKQINGDNIDVVFEQDQFAICPGQKIVLYEDGIVVAGGTIVSTEFKGNK